MPIKTTLQLTPTEYSVQNFAYRIKLERIRLRLNMDAACDRTKLKNTALWLLEKGDLKEGCYDTMVKAATGYAIPFSKAFINASTAPSATDWDELDAKGIELGIKQHRKDWPAPGTREDKQQAEEWQQWGQMRLDRFYKRLKGDLER